MGGFVQTPGMRTVAEIQDAISKLSEKEQGELLRWLEIQLGMREMVEQVARLTQSYVIWWEIANSKNVKRYSGVLQEYRDFFEPVAHILLWQGFFVICYQLFDQRQDSKHIHFRIDQVAQTDARLADEMRKKINNFAVLTKIKTIRHKISVHRDRNRIPQQVCSFKHLLFSLQTATTLANWFGIPLSLPTSNMIYRLVFPSTPSRPSVTSLTSIRIGLS